MNVNRAIRAALAAGVVAGVTLGSSGVASAAKPANQACVGESLSALAASQSPGTFGGDVSGLARNPLVGEHGLGVGIQFLQAGDVLDELIPNTCND